MRKILAAVTAVACTVTFAAETLPDWAEREIAAAAARYEGWKGTNETVAFVCITDIHGRKLGLADPNDFSDPRLHIRLASACAERIGAALIADLGDHDFDWVCSTAKDALGREKAIDSRFADLKELYAEALKSRPVLFCMGNHDHHFTKRNGNWTVDVTSARFGEALNALSARAGHAMSFSPCKSWGYHDIPDRKTRVFFLNTHDAGYCGYSAAQLQFVADALASLGPGWQAAAVQHYCIYQPIGNWMSWKADGCGNGKAMIRLLEDFVHRRKGEGGGAKWDFTSVKDAFFAGLFCGDSHFDNQIEVNYVHYTVFQGYGGCPKSEQAYGSVITPFDRSRMMLFDIVAFKPATREARTFRVGAGGAARDRAYRYDRLKIDTVATW